MQRELITNINTRIEKHILKSNNQYFYMIIDFCHKSKNLYNHANYIIRQTLLSNKNKYIQYVELNKILKSDTEYPDYKEMPTAQSAQQTLKLLCQNWKSFFKSIKDWNKNKYKYNGKPKPPKYLKKDSNYILILTNQNCKIKNNKIYFPKVFNGFTITPKFINKDNFYSFQQVRLIPKKNKIIIEIIYNIKTPNQKQDNQKYVGIDIGINNFATVCNNISKQAFIINGKPLKSINQYYNKQISHYREICKRMNDKNYSNRMNKLTEKRNAKINDYIHKASRYIINYCIKYNINTIVIGKNKKWKQNIKLSKKVNQNFIQIPFVRFIEMIEYKAQEHGITVKLTEESYTSGTSFMDNEIPTKKNYNKTRRIFRGLFKSNNGTLINSDLNGAYQILKKVVPIKWNRGCALHPVVVNII